MIFIIETAYMTYKEVALAYAAYTAVAAGMTLYDESVHSDQEKCFLKYKDNPIYKTSVCTSMYVPPTPVPASNETEIVNLQKIIHEKNKYIENLTTTTQTLKKTILDQKIEISSIKKQNSEQNIIIKTLTEVISNQSLTTNIIVVGFLIVLLFALIGYLLRQRKNDQSNQLFFRVCEDQLHNIDDQLVADSVRNRNLLRQ